MTHRPSTTHASRTRAAAWLALLGLALTSALPAIHFAPRGAPTLAVAAGAPAAQSLSAPEAIRSHLSCPVCLVLAQARSAALPTGDAVHAGTGAGPVLASGVAERSPASPDRDDQRPRAPPLAA